MISFQGHVPPSNRFANRINLVLSRVEVLAVFFTVWPPAGRVSRRDCREPSIDPTFTTPGPPEGKRTRPIVCDLLISWL